MRFSLTMLFVAAAYCVLGQSNEKGQSVNCSMYLSRYHMDEIAGAAAGQNVIVMFLFSNVDYPDTVCYELEEQDSVTVVFKVSDNVGFGAYDRLWPMSEDLVYGSPVYDSVDCGYTSSGGNRYHRSWSFTDSALFHFKLIGGTPYYVKLTKKQPLPVPATVEEVPEPELAIFPNPTTNELFIGLPADYSAEMSLMDAAGRLVETWDSVGPHRIDLSDFQPGSYLLRIGSAGQIRTFRVHKI